MARVVVGLSGGVDSSVAAWLLKEQGHDVIGIFMRNWHDETVVINNECPWIDDSNDAMLVAESLNIPFQVLDLSQEYHERIVDYMFDEYKAGRTPNPDVLCNREIKFDVFLHHALQLGADFVATGHYCRKDTIIDSSGKEIHRLLSGADSNKDQSYFLCSVSQNQLAKALFPIGELQKSEVRTIAGNQGFVTAEKKDSQGLCFIGKVKLPTFLQQKLATKQGEIIEIPEDHPIYKFNEPANDLFTKSEPLSYTKAMGQKVGEHQGAHFYTMGQRKGLNVGGRPLPSFVIDTDVDENLIFTGQGDSHPGLRRRVIRIANSDVHWIRPDLRLSVGQSKDFSLRIRYRQPLQTAKLTQEANHMFVEFENPQRSVAPGQFAAWYLNDELIGSGVIEA
ncbi:MAG: tRNA 2-thiouridine(34) synthase MnmA [Flavobacteriales bacterium]|nr:tRNA 2-thiouridine(34) synthase MnmA [Flavobacteriales bacterium]